MIADVGGDTLVPGTGARPGLTARWAEWRPHLAAVAAWAAALILIAVFASYARSVIPHMGDLRVYRSAGTQVLAGRPVYPPVPAWMVPELGRSVLVFTYPPVAAILAVPLALLPWQVAELAWIPVIYVPLGIVIWLAFRPLLARAGRWTAAAFGAVFVACMCLCPMLQNMRFGQVDILLAALCLADLATRHPRWPRGLLIGLAAAVKLTPAVFIVYLLLTGRRKAAAVSAGSMAAFTGLSWLLIPHDFATFWTSAVFQPNRLGPNASLSNQSIRAMLLRLYASAPVPVALWLALALAAACAGLAAARAASKRGDEVSGVAIVGLLAVLVSPVSWIHHMVWVVVALGAIVGNGMNRQRWLVAIGTAALFVIPIPNRAWDPLFEQYAPVILQTIVQDSFGIAAAILIAIIAMLPAPVPAVSHVPAQREPGGRETPARQETGARQGVADRQQTAARQETAARPDDTPGRLLEPHPGTGQR